MALRQLLDLPSDDVRQVVDRMPVAVMPIGSVEQHGSHLPCGTDTFAAEVVARSVAEKLDCLYVPFGPYGITLPHVGFPGTVSLSRGTFEGLLTDISTELIRMGVKLFVLVNWHEAHMPAIDAVCAELQFQHGARFVVAHAQFVAQRVYAPHNGRLTHGGGIETLAVMAHDPDLVRADRITTPQRTEKAEALDAMRRSSEIYGFVTDIRELSRDGWYGEPAWATLDRAKDFADDIATEILGRLEGVWQTLGVERPSPTAAPASP